MYESVDEMIIHRLACAVTVKAAGGVRGLLLQGRRKSTNLVVGQYVIDVDSQQPAAAVRTVECDGPDDTLVGWYAAGSSSLSFTWMPPDDGADGPLEFVYVAFSRLALCTRGSVLFCQKHTKTQ